MSFVIEKSVPLPEHRGSPKWRQWDDLFGKMHVGDSVLMNRKDSNSFRTILFRVDKEKRYRLLARKEGGENQIRVWKALRNP